MTDALKPHVLHLAIRCWGVNSNIHTFVTENAHPTRFLSIIHFLFSSKCRDSTKLLNRIGVNERILTCHRGFVMDLMVLLDPELYNVIENTWRFKSSAFHFFNIVGLSTPSTPAVDKTTNVPKTSTLLEYQKLRAIIGQTLTWLSKVSRTSVHPIWASSTTAIGFMTPQVKAHS